MNNKWSTFTGSDEMLEEVQRKVASYIDDLHANDKLDYATYSNLRDDMYEYIEEAFDCGASAVYGEMCELLNY